MKAIAIFSKIALLSLLMSPLAASAQEAPGAAPAPNPGQVFAGLTQSYRNLNDYAVTIHAKINLPTIRIPDFTATLYFKKPDRFHVETKSFAPIPRNSGVFNPFQFAPEKNRIAYQRTENLGGIRADLYRVEPLDARTPVRYYHVWVGNLPARILQVENLTIRGTKGIAKLLYTTVAQGAEQWLLPENVHIHLTFPEGASNPDAFSFTTRDNPVSTGMGRLNELSGEGDVHITYSGWRVNAGLDDRLFNP
jgi:hypothetical protein